MSSATILLGSVLTFATTDGRFLELSVSLTEPATVALSWGDLARSSTTARVHHAFTMLPVPEGQPTAYRLAIGREPVRELSVDPIGTRDRLRVAVYGDSRDGSAPHRLILDQIRARNVDLIIHSGDVIRRASDEPGWIEHLAATFPISSRRPLIFALGNHEIAADEPASAADGLARAMLEIPPPLDPVAREEKAPPSAFHVRVGPALFVSLDSNASLAEGSPQLVFLARVLEARGDARFVFVCYHHGPLSSGPHGPHDDGEAVIRLLEAHGVTASIAGHDHTYERLIRNGITYVVSGGGGAPLYAKARTLPGSQAFASTYNWVELDLEGTTGHLEAFGLEGTLLDRADLPAPRDAGPSERDFGRGFVPLGFFLVLVAFLFVAARVAKRRGDA